MTKFTIKITVIGNAAGGKTRLSRRLGELYQIPVHHVDSHQFLPGMKLRNLEDTRKRLRKITDETESWLIDGYGPLDILEERLIAADRIIFIDLPLGVHYFWAFKRVIENFWSRRVELPEGCSEVNLEHVLKLFRTIHRIHYKMRPEMLKILSRTAFADKTIWIKDHKSWQQIYRHGLPT